MIAEAQTLAGRSVLIYVSVFLIIYALVGMFCVYYVGFNMLFTKGLPKVN